MSETHTTAGDADRTTNPREGSEIKGTHLDDSNDKDIFDPALDLTQYGEVFRHWLVVGSVEERIKQLCWKYTATIKNFMEEWYLWISWLPIFGWQ